MQAIVSSQKETVIAIGKFEALHKGHVHLITTTVEYAKNYGLKSCVLHFVPNPIKILYDSGYKSLFSKEEYNLLLANYGLDYSIPYTFDSSVAQLSPAAFCSIIKEQFSCKTLIVGEEFRFGQDRAGNAELLSGLSAKLDMQIVVVPIVKLADDSEKISTSQIRRYLAQSQIRQANKILASPFLVMGTVTKGRQLGRTIGFPTANIMPPPDKFLPPNGVYVTQVLLDGKRLNAITNIGTNPTVTSETNCKVETHIFNFDQDIYGKQLIVEFYEFIRPETTFSGITELQQQMQADADIARGLKY
ncbi:MAG: bifunctional riboflavin kinase/FAD synthetase [Defluviitaleaceae bacterium]|nr:bifunctional riboflavin kinase/FAD synthetase [Defluviitaleaceae bacterium]